MATILPVSRRQINFEQDIQTSFFASVTLTLNRWPWYSNLTWTFRRCTCAPKMSFLGKGFQKLQHYKYRQTDRRTHRQVRLKTFYGHYRSTFTAKQSISVKKNAKQGLLRRSRSFKVIEVGINRKPVCDFLLVINTNWYPISYRFGVIAAYCSNFGHFAFMSPLWRA